MRGGGGGGKEVEERGKVMGPLFPRLHVNDAAKGGGPRAPPRNKMALYEQFTVPSHRFSGGGGALASARGSLARSTSAASQSQVRGSALVLDCCGVVTSESDRIKARKMISRHK
jgi:EARLY FLOWERING 3 protein